jgi:hypothetical protein
MSMEYIRKTYGLDVKAGDKGTYTDSSGIKHEAIVRRSRGAYLRVAVPTMVTRLLTLHPQDEKLNIERSTK